VVVVAYVSETGDAPAPSFSATAEKHRDDYLFGLTTDPKAIADAGITPPAIVLYRKFDDPKINYPAATIASASVEDIESFLKENSVPLVDEVNADNYQAYASSGLPLAYLFLDATDETRDEHIAYLRPLAKAHKGKLNFVWIDAVKFADHAKALNLHEAKWPAFVVQDLSEQLKYPLDQNEVVTESTVSSWVTEYLAGNLKPQLKSQAVPETQDENVFTLVSTQFDDVVFDNDKDVFVEFYAPWSVFLSSVCLWLPLLTRSSGAGTANG
jgi:protein disulfide-isomerase A1